MNWKKFFFAFIAAFVFLFVFGFLWYATLMHDAHREVPTLLRPEADAKELLRMACAWSVRHGFLFHAAVRPVSSERTRRRRSDAGPSGGVSVRRATFDLVRSPTINVQNPLRLDRWRGNPIHSRRRNRRRHLQTSDQRHHVCKGAVALTA